jgi:non-ribosomal peptide synthetase-like protein
VEDGWLTIGPVTLGRNCWIGNRSSLGSGVVMEDGSGLDDLSMIGDGARVPAGELWRGSPAAPAGSFKSEPSRVPWTPVSWIAHIVGVFLFPIIILAAVFPGFMAITYIGHVNEGYGFLLASPLVALSFIVLLCAELWLFKWLLIGRFKPGCYPLGGYYYARKWFFDQLLFMSSDVTESFYETLFIAPWLRALGARIGPRCEMATMDLVYPDLLDMGGECMIASSGMLGAQRVRSGWFTLGTVNMGRRVFIGNSAVLPADTALGNNVLIGLMSTPPSAGQGVVPDGTSWFGSPPMELPMRYHSGRFSESRTYRPPKRLVALRLFIEFFRVLVPLTLFLAMATLMVDTTDSLQDYIGLRHWLLILPLLYAAAGVLSVLTTAAIKWLVVGRYREGERPLWSHFVWRNDLINAVYSNFCTHFFLDILKGTPFIAWALRCFGMKIGKRCHIDMTDFTEFDLVRLGDEVALNDRSIVQTHLFEDRIIKMGSVNIGNRCSVGAGAIVLYNTRMEEGSSLGDLSLLMKGETLPARTHWRGIPCRKSTD